MSNIAVALGKLPDQNRMMELLVTVPCVHPLVSTVVCMTGVILGGVQPFGSAQNSLRGTQSKDLR
jgi:hypothetical protein